MDELSFSWRDCHARYINLSHRQDRNEHMKWELERVGLNGIVKRFEAIKTKDEGWNIEPYKKMYQRTRGAIGCMLSQMQVMQDAFDNGKSAMVFEDDLIIGSDATHRFDYIENFINTKEPDADLIFFGGTAHVPAWWHGEEHEPMLKPYCKCDLKRDMERIDDERMVRVYGMFSTHAYMVPWHKIPKILKLLNDVMSISIGIDFSLIIHQPNLRCFAYLPGIIKQFNAESDIGTGITYFENFSKLNGSIENSKYWWADKQTDVDLSNFNWQDATKR